MNKDIHKSDLSHIENIKIEKEDVSFIGKTIVKRSAKPFKSGDKLAIVTGFSKHPFTKKLCFVLEDNSIIECFRCKLYD